MKRFWKLLVGGSLTLLLVLLTLVSGVLVKLGFISMDTTYIERLSTQLAGDPGVTAFVNVTVLDLRGGEPLQPDQTVIVEGGQITQRGSASQVLVPAGATIIDGAGQYLMPGLVDAHVHVKDQHELLLFVAAGVTSVRDLWGTTGVQLALGFPDQLEMQSRINQGDLFGPTIYAAGPIMEGGAATHPLLDTFTTPQAARQSVAWQAAQGYQYVKVYDYLAPEVYQAIIDEARQHDLPVIGHVPYAVGLDLAINSGQHSIEHLTGFVDPETAELLVPQSQLDQSAQRVAQAGIWICPTLVLYTRLVPEAEIIQLQAQSELQYVPPWLRSLWPFFASQMRANLRYTGEDYPGAITQVNRQVMQALHRAGARFVVGTDTDNPFLIPGMSMHEEMEAMVAAGLSPYEVLQAATLHGSAVVGFPETFGAVMPGQRADLILLTANPLENISAIRSQAGVMLRGRWLSRVQLDTMLAELPRSYTPSLVDWLLPLTFALLSVCSLLLTLIMLRKTNRIG